MEYQLRGGAAGLEALKSADYEKKVRDYVEKERKWLYDQLKALGLRVVAGQANYLLFEAPESVRGPLGEWLLRRGIMVRCCDDYENLDESFYRIGINTHEANEILIEKIGEWLG